MSIPVSTWYTDLANYTFPTVFIRLNEAEKEIFTDKKRTASIVNTLIGKIDYVIDHLPGSSFIHADSCAPTDSPLFRKSDAVKVGSVALDMLLESDKVTEAFKEEKSIRIALHPYRRVNKMREFRMFIVEGKLKITDGNPKYKGKPICKECEGYRKLLRNTK